MMICRLLIFLWVTLTQDNDVNHSFCSKNTNFNHAISDVRFDDTKSSYDCQINNVGLYRTNEGESNVTYESDQTNSIFQPETTTSSFSPDEDDTQLYIDQISRDIISNNIDNNVHQVKKVPRKRKWHKGFRLAAGWSRNPPPPPNPCDAGPCANGGSCTRTGDYTYTCACVAGYRGSTCTIANPCDAGPCSNGGSCTRTGDYTYTCACVPGYGGTTCTIDINECASSPCQNQQTCTDHINYYTCSCTDRYNGTHCEKDCRPGPADILFVIDVSKSAENTLNKSLGFIDRFLNILPIGPQDFQMAAITYSKTAVLEFDFDDHHNNDSLRNAFYSLQSKGLATYTGVAITYAREVLFNSTLGSRSSAYKYVIMLYDGMSTDRTSAVTLRQSLLPVSTGVKVYAVGVGEQVDHSELLQIATDNDYVFSATNDDAINKILEETSHDDCDDCIETYQTDILLVVDASASNSVTEFQELLSTTGELVKHLDIETNIDIQLSLISFADGIKRKYSFGVFSQNDDVLSAIQTISRTSTKAFGAEALRYARQEAFVASNGGRDNVRQMVIIISNAKWEDHGSLVNEANLLKDSGIVMMNVGNGIDTEIEKFYDISTDAHHVFLVLDQETEPLRAIASAAKYTKCDSDIFHKRV